MPPPSVPAAAAAHRRHPLVPDLAPPPRLAPHPDSRHQRLALAAALALGLTAPTRDPPTHTHHTLSLTTASRIALTTPVATLTFHARNMLTISLETYLLRILKMSNLSGDAVGRSFVIESFNIHRLVIAGVTLASKFFSVVFYANSRYAKVGGLPLTELNQLELQFLLLNDFRLVISSAEMQRYAEQLHCLVIAC
ncbi:hypothetical protein H0H87_012202 [Tephrocybe sp. NHM501043]|nr:hypothetical protein H0H87_012202 [Tephrocybe sp. NHM501043]